MAIHTVNPRVVGFDTVRLSRLDDSMHRFVDEGQLPGVFTLVARKGQIAHLDMYGMADIEAGEPLQEDTLFRIYSMSKPITTAALMTLFEEGRVLLNDPVSRYIPAFADLKVLTGGTMAKPELADLEQEITIAHLLTHTSGLLYGMFGKTLIHRLQAAPLVRLQQTNPDADLAEWTDALLTAPLAFQPGTAFGYGTSIDVIGRVIEIVSGQALDTFLKERIFDPLGMADTAFDVPDEKLDRLAANYMPAKNGDGLRCIDSPAESVFRAPVHCFQGGGGLISTMSDYQRFCQAMVNGGELEGTRILGPRTLAAMCRNHLPAGIWARNQPGLGWGLGWAVHMDPGALHELVSPGACHWGGAASTKFWIDPREDLFCVVMTQMMGGDYPILERAMAGVYQALVN